MLEYTAYSWIPMSLKSNFYLPQCYTLGINITSIYTHDTSCRSFLLTQYALPCSARNSDAPTSPHLWSWQAFNKLTNLLWDGIHAEGIAFHNCFAFIQAHGQAVMMKHWDATVWQPVSHYTERDAQRITIFCWRDSVHTCVNWDHITPVLAVARGCQ